MTDFKIPASSKAVPVFCDGLYGPAVRAAGHPAMVPETLHEPV